MGIFMNIYVDIIRDLFYCALTTKNLQVTYLLHSCHKSKLAESILS